MVPLAPGSDRNPQAFRAIPRIHWSVLPPSSRWWWTLLHRPPRCTSAPSPTIGDWLLVDAIVTWGNLRGNGWIFSSKKNITFHFPKLHCLRRFAGSPFIGAYWHSGPWTTSNVDASSNCFATGSLSKIFPSRVAARGSRAVTHRSTSCSLDTGQTHQIADACSANTTDSGRVTFWCSFKALYLCSCFTNCTNHAHLFLNRNGLAFSIKRLAGSCHPPS